METAETKIANLERQRAYLDLKYQNSGWGMGAKYRAELSQIDRQLTELRELAA